ncbi:MAG: HAMP domain-containing sensor histidine kinase [Crocinitomicaceae bacterium]
MRNSFLYILISTMVVALIGIILIQGIWINDAYDQKKAELKLHANEALNQLVDKISEDEAESYLNLKFGGVDSILNEVIVLEGSNGKEISENVVVIQGNHRDSIKNQIKIEVRTDDHKNVKEKGADVEFKQKTKGHNTLIHQIHENLIVKMEEIHEDLEKDLHWVGGIGDKMDKIESIVQHFTYEKLFAGDLKDRLPKEALEKKIEEVLADQGLGKSYQYVVQDRKKGEFVEDYQSDSYNDKKEAYEKALFPKDKANSGDFILLLQLENEDGIIWSHIHPMIWMSVIFTLLIIIAFSFALYFIFKQKKVSRIKNDFINNMTHELKTPLASISLASASIKHPEVISNPKQINEFVDVIEKERIRMNSHIERVLEMASMENNQFKLKLEKENLKKLINRSIGNVKLSLENQEGKIDWDCELDQVLIKADAFHLVNALTNVLDNSIKYSDKNPEINLELKEVGMNYELTIQDNGIGMSKKSVKLAFDKFYREETGNIHNRKGFGLGLSYVKSIVEGHHGEVSLESTVNKGTTVKITLPKYGG